MPADAITLAQDLINCVAEAGSLKQLRNSTLQALNRWIQSSALAWIHQTGAEWTVVSSTTSLAEIPTQLIAKAAEREEIDSDSKWLAIPLHESSSGVEILLVAPPDAITREQAESLSRLLQAAINMVEQREQIRDEVNQLNALLTLAARWQTERNPSRLLCDIAEAAAKLLHGERASIFLWDRAHRELVGNPALGVEEPPLRIRDDLGVAGRVLKTRIPYRWDATQDPHEINAEVGKRLGYVTRSLIAVPLLDARGRPLGVFEVLNHRNGRFSEKDQRVLIELARHAAAAVENSRQIAELSAARDRFVQSASESVQLVGNCPQIRRLRDTIARVGPTDLAVLILGENGTGKEVVARRLHLLSERRDKPFLAVNCAAMAETLLESELFGHEKGAFTDAVAERAGKFELASGGTLFLDEIGEMSLSGQAKLLRVLEEKTVMRVGGTQPIRTDVRVIAATNQDVVKLVREKKFREDLYFRLNVVTLHLPPLRERGEDITLLAEYFLEHFAHQVGRRPPRLSDKARSRLLSHTWPGNVRELRNLMERVSYLTRGEVVDEADLEFVLSPTAAPETDGIPFDLPLSEATAAFQRQYIQRHIDAAAGNLAQAAKAMGMHRSNLYRKMQQLGIEHEPRNG